MTEIVVTQNECLRCGYVWIARVNNVKRCPKCCNPKWNIPRKIKVIKNEG
jgi:predicted Zn-ribbon and HTH transcriptional regulator